MHPSPVGRPRDPSIDEAVLGAARQHLATVGYEGMSVVGVADAAGTTRQAVYRRWSSKADLATAAIAGMSRADERLATDDPFRDLVVELSSFHDAMRRPNGIGMVGAMFQSATDPTLVELFRERLVGPRRVRIRRILDRAVDAGLADPDADLDYATTSCTGVFYARHLALGQVEPDWAERTAALVWRSIGGTVDR